MSLDLTKLLELVNLCDKTDGGSRPAVSDGAVVDYISGEIIPNGAPTIEYYDADGVVYATCKKPIDDIIKTAGDVIPAGTIINGSAIVAAYTVQNGEEWIFDGDEACLKARLHAVTLEEINPNAGMGGDDTAALHGAIDKALAQRTRVQLGGKTYNFDQPILIDVDRETILIEGCGTESKRFDGPPYSDGSILNSRIATGDAFTFKGVQTQIRDMTLAGVTSGYVMATELFQMTSVKNLHIDAAGDLTNGMKIGASFTNIFENIDIYKRVRNNTAIGLWHNTTGSTAGGNMLMTNVTASYFKHNIELGQEAQFVGNPRHNNTFINIQGRFGETGIRIGSGYANAEVINAWGEHNTYAQMQVHSGAGPIWFRGGHLGGGAASGHGLVLGLDPALAIGPNLPICAVTMQGASIRAWGGFAGVRVFPAADPEPDTWHEFDAVKFWNNGGARFLTDQVAQKPILYRRPKYNDPQGFWANVSLVRYDNNGTPVNFPATDPNYPLALQTTPFTQI